MLVLALLVACRARLRESRALGLVRSVRTKLRTKLKTVVTLYQIATRIPTVFHVPFPASATTLLDGFESIFSPNLSSFSRTLGCLGLGMLSMSY